MPRSLPSLSHVDPRTADSGARLGWGGGGPLLPLLTEGVGLQVLVTTRAPDNASRPLPAANHSSPRAGPAPLGQLSKACPQHPPRSRARPAGVSSVTGTCSGGEEHSPGRPGRSMGWEGPAPRGCQRRHLLVLAVSLLLTRGPGKPGWAGASRGQSRRDTCLRLPSPSRSAEVFCFLAKAQVTAGQMRLRVPN